VFAVITVYRLAFREFLREQGDILGSREHLDYIIVPTLYYKERITVICSTPSSPKLLSEGVALF